MPLSASESTAGLALYVPGARTISMVFGERSLRWIWRENMIASCSDAKGLFAEPLPPGAALASTNIVRPALTTGGRGVRPCPSSGLPLISARNSAAASAWCSGQIIPIAYIAFVTFQFVSNDIGCLVRFKSKLFTLKVGIIILL